LNIYAIVATRNSFQRHAAHITHKRTGTSSPEKQLQATRSTLIRISITSSCVQND